MAIANSLGTEKGKRRSTTIVRSDGDRTPQQTRFSFIKKQSAVTTEQYGYIRSLRMADYQLTTYNQGRREHT